MSTKFVRLALQPEAVKAAEGNNQELAVMAGMTYLTGGWTWWKFRKEFYPPGKFGGDILYSNARFLGFKANSEAELKKGKVTVPSTDRKRGTLWFMVGVSDVKEGKAYAAIMGWVFDQGAQDSRKLTVEELSDPIPLFWYGKTDTGKFVGWTDAVIEERNRHVRGKGEDEAKSRARP